jgi:hypothetical protein
MRSAAFLLLLLFSHAGAAHAGCCDVVKLDIAVATVAVRVCEPDAEGACGAVLFEGELSVGQSQSVCAAASTLVYQERLPAASEYEPPVTAVCDGGDVEI